MSGAFYTGSSADGRDIRPAEGMYVSEDGTWWSSEPITPEQKEYSKNLRALYNHIDGKRTPRDEYNLIKEKKSKLPRSVRDWVIKQFEHE